MSAVLDNPIWASLTGAHAYLAQRQGRAARYPDDVAPFTALSHEGDERAWADLAVLAGSGATVWVPGSGAHPPSWQEVRTIAGVQLEGTAVAGAADAEAVRLGARDVPEMMDLVARTDPGPFRSRTVELGTYLGIRRGGVLVAMAGQRLRPPGWTEVSTVCTDESVRGQGLATRLIRAVVAEIRSRGDLPFLHAAHDNHSAIRLYESLGFSLRRHTAFMMVQVP